MAAARRPPASHAIHHRWVERRALLQVLAISGIFFVAEVVGGLVSGSLALLADAGHLLTDIAAILVAVVAFWYAGKPADASRTYGFVRAEILGGLFNGVSLVLVAAYVVYEAARRIGATREINGWLMLAVGAAGLAGNLVGVFLLRRTESTNLNVRGVLLHLLGDGLSSLAVVVSAGVIIFAGWTLIDPVTALLIAVIILVAAVRLILSTVDVLMESVPIHIDLEQVRDFLLTAHGVESVHDLHVWTLTSGCVAMSAHVRLAGAAPMSGSDMLLLVRQRLKERYGIDHLTLQIERADMPDEEVHIVGDHRCLA